MQMRGKSTAGSRVRNVALSALCALLLTACGEKPEAMIASARTHRQERPPAATIQLKNALQKDASLGEARYLLGKIYLEQGDYPGAEKELTRAFEAGYAPIRSFRCWPRRWCSPARAKAGHPASPTQI